MASLSSDQKRDLAALVAERAAPQLVARIDEEAGLDLTPEQVNAVVTMAERIDPDELATLRSEIRDRERRGQALRTLGGTLAAAAGLGSAEPAMAEPFDDVALPPPDPALLVDGPQPPDAGDATRLQRDPDLDQDREQAGDTDHAGTGRTGVDQDSTADPSPADRPTWAAEASAGPTVTRTAPTPFVSVFDRLPNITTDGSAGADRPTTPPADTTEDDQFTGPTDTGEPDTVTDSASPDDTDLEGDLTARVRAARMPLVEALRGPGGNGARLRILRQRVDDLAAMDPVQHTAIVDAIPDGWARRRAVELLISHGDMTSAEAALLVGKLGSHQARAWLSASAIEAGLLDLDGVQPLVDHRAFARLERRYG
jgi:hypothetical protein